MVLSKVTHSILADTKGMKSRLQGQSHFTALQNRTEGMGGNGRGWGRGVVGDTHTLTKGILRWEADAEAKEREEGILDSVLK